MFGYYGATTVPPKPPLRKPQSSNSGPLDILPSDILPSFETRINQVVTPPPGYVAPTPANPYPTTPESHTWLYIGLALGAIVIVGGIVLIVEDR